MDIQITSLDGDASGSVTLSDDVFGLEPRQDILQRNGPLAARQATPGHARHEGPL